MFEVAVGLVGRARSPIQAITWHIPRYCLILGQVMGRLARVVAADVPHHLTQRGNGRRLVLDCDADRSVYLKLLLEDVALYKVSLIGYCLMSNHIHLIAVPRTADGLAQALKHTHGRYASY